MKIPYPSRRRFLRQAAGSTFATMTWPQLLHSEMAPQLHLPVHAGPPIPTAANGCVSFDDDGRIFDGPARGVTSDVKGQKLEDAIFDSIIYADPNALPGRPALIQFYISWRDLEPEDGIFRFERLDAIMAGLRKLGKRATWRFDCSMGDTWNPKSGYPKWLLDKMPESQKRVIVFSSSRGAHGERIEINYENEQFLNYLERFIRTVAERYDGNPTIEYIDLRVIGRFGEWGGWNDADNFPFQHKRQTVERIIGIYGRAFTKSMLTMEVPGRTYKGDPIQDMTDWGFDIIWAQKYPNFLIRTDTNEGFCDFFAQRFYPTSTHLVGWIFERFTAKMRTTFEGLGAWRGYKEILCSVDRYVDNALFRLRSNYVFYNGLEPFKWWNEFFQPMFGESTDRMERNYAYRVRPAYVTWQSGERSGKRFIRVSHVWVNTGVGQAPTGFSPVVILSDPDTGKILLQRAAVHTAAQFSNIRNSDYVHIETTLELPEKAGSRVRVELAAQNPANGAYLQIPVDGAKDGTHVRVVEVRFSGQVFRRKAAVGETVRSWSRTYEAEAAWEVENATTVRSPENGPISPRLEKLADCRGATIRWADVLVPEDGDYLVSVNAQSSKDDHLGVEVEGLRTEIAISATGDMTKPSAKFSVMRKLTAGLHDIIVKTPNSGAELAIDRLRVEKIQSDISSDAAPTRYALKATRLCQSSKSSVPISTLSWWPAYWSNIKNLPGLTKSVNESSPVAIDDIHVRQGAKGFYLEGLRADSWMVMAPLYVHHTMDYRAILVATVKGDSPRVVMFIDGYPVASMTLFKSDGSVARYEVASRTPLEAGIHEIRLNIEKSDGNWSIEEIALEPISVEVPGNATALTSRAMLS